MARVLGRLLDAGAAADINAEDADGETALLLAARRGHQAAVELMLEHGAATDQANRSGVTPLIAAALFGHDGTVEVLLARCGTVARSAWRLRQPTMHVSSALWGQVWAGLGSARAPEVRDLRFCSVPSGCSHAEGLARPPAMSSIAAHRSTGRRWRMRRRSPACCCSMGLRGARWTATGPPQWTWLWSTTAPKWCRCLSALPAAAEGRGPLPSTAPGKAHGMCLAAVHSRTLLVECMQLSIVFLPVYENVNSLGRGNSEVRQQINRVVVKKAAGRVEQGAGKRMSSARSREHKHHIPIVSPSATSMAAAAATSCNVARPLLLATRNWASTPAASNGNHRKRGLMLWADAGQQPLPQTQQQLRQHVQ